MESLIILFTDVGGEGHKSDQNVIVSVGGVYFCDPMVKNSISLLKNV